MKTNKFLNYTAIALVLASPTIASAKGANAANQNAARIANGALDTTANGAGTYSRTSTKTGNVTTASTTRTYDNGTTGTTTALITRSTNGTIERDTTTVNAAGKTVNRSETLIPNGDGTYSVAGATTNGQGQITNQFTGTQNTGETILTLTNAKGATATVDTNKVDTGDATATFTTGTNYKGQAINTASLVTDSNMPSY